MKTNTYLGLIGLQLGMGALQQNALDEKQAARDAEQLALTEQAAKTAQSAHYAQWRQTPDGRHFETWRDAALDITTTVRNRNDAWRAIWDATLATELEQAQQPADVSKPKRRLTIATVATGTLWLLALLLVGPTDPNSIAANIGTGFAVIGLIPLALIIISVFQIRQRRTIHDANTGQAAHQAHANRYGSSSIPSWHPNLSYGRIIDVTAMIDATIMSGPRDFPAPSALQPLRPLLATNAKNKFPTALPFEARKLLDVFDQEDQEKIGRLEATHLA